MEFEKNNEVVENKDVLADIPSEETVLTQTDETQKDPASESPTETKPIDEKKAEAPTSEGASTPDDDNVPFHKNPRWQKLYGENKEMKARLAELEQFRDEARSRLEEEKKSSPQEIPERFKRLYGNDPEAYRLWQEEMRENRALAIKEWQEEQRRITEHRQKELDFWKKKTDETLSTMREEGKQFDERELIAIATRFRPMGADGLIDLQKAYDIMVALKGGSQPARTEAKKSVADTAAPVKNSGAQKQRDYLTSADLRGKTFQSLI